MTRDRGNSGRENLKRQTDAINLSRRSSEAEQLIRNQWVGGSTPLAGFSFSDSGSVEWEYLKYTEKRSHRGVLLGSRQSWQGARGSWRQLKGAVLVDEPVMSFPVTLPMMGLETQHEPSTVDLAFGSIQAHLSGGMVKSS